LKVGKSFLESSATFVQPMVRGLPGIF
jgi:hypothetical protein